jgi:DNA-binding beta-propeller fold protein YncE
MKQNRSWINLVLYISLCSSCTNAQTQQTTRTDRTTSDTVIAPQQQKSALKPYHNLVATGTEILQSAPGTKSVLFNASGSKLYALNLEGMSVYEFDQVTRKVAREFKFRPNRGTGWDYDTDKPIRSFQEKPVEACFSHDGNILWVSLHNAEGIVPIFVNDEMKMKELFRRGDTANKKMAVYHPATKAIDSVAVPLIHTGKTPKVIAVSADSKHLLVSNWHSYTISVLELDSKTYPYGKVIKTIPMGAIPRGVVVDDKRNKSYIAIMGGARINVIDNTTWEADTSVQVASNPRHIVMDDNGRLFISYNKLSKVACIDPVTGKTLFTAETGEKPRTIMLSKNKKFLFVTCYKGDAVDVFKINNDSFTKIYSLPCKGSPVGVDIFEDDQKLEAWVCNYTLGSINVFSFRKE